MIVDKRGTGGKESKQQTTPCKVLLTLAGSQTLKADVA
jgi:hypothetical protein